MQKGCVCVEVERLDLLCMPDHEQSTIWILLTTRNKEGEREDEKRTKQKKGLVPAVLATAHTRKWSWRNSLPLAISRISQLPKMSQGYSI